MWARAKSIACTIRSLAAGSRSKVLWGLKPHTVEETIRDNADSLLKWGLVKTRPGEDNWQREGNDLGIKSKWRPHTYPALDPELKSKPEAQTTARAS